MTLAELTLAVRNSRGFTQKRDVAATLRALPAAAARSTAPGASQVPLGDDCAAIADGDGYLLFAIEGLVADFVQTLPWFAGYSAVMVNVSDIYAMGGRPLAVVDALWSAGAAAAAPILEGMSAASLKYGVPLVGGHSNCHADGGQVAVAIVGRAQRLLTSFDALPGDALVMAVDLRGAWHDPYPFWDASSAAPGERLVADLELLPRLAEDGLCDSAKDISMAGTLGTTLMLCECSAVGAVVDLDRVPMPAGVEPLRWLCAFPSYGFILSVRPERLAQVVERFAARGLAARCIGEVTADSEVVLSMNGERATLWDWAQDSYIAPARVREAQACLSPT